MGLQIGSGDQTRASHFVEEKKEKEGWGGRKGIGKEEDGRCVVCACGGGIGGWVGGFWG